MSGINSISGSPTTPIPHSPSQASGPARLVIRTADQARDHWRAITNRTQAAQALEALDGQMEGGHIDEETYRQLANALMNVHNTPSGPARLVIRTADEAINHWRAITNRTQAAQAMEALDGQMEGGHIDEETYRQLGIALMNVHNTLQRATMPVRPPVPLWQPPAPGMGPPVLPEHQAVMAQLSTTLSLQQRFRVSRFLCLLEQQGLSWSALAPAAGEVRPAALEAAVNTAITQHGLHPSARAAINRAFNVVLRGPSGR